MNAAKRTNEWLDLLQLPDFTWWQFLTAAACLVVLIWLIVRFVSGVHEDVDPAESDQDMLNAISELRREGDLTEDEYRSIKSQLMGRMSTTFPGKARGTHHGKKNGLQPDAASKNISLLPIGNKKNLEVSDPEKSESIQSITSSSLTEDPEPPHDTSNKTTGSAATEAENG